MRIVLPLLFMPAAAIADPHWMSDFYHTAPCAEIVATIDAPTLNDTVLKARLERLSRKTMAFGFLLGYQAATGPLNANQDTVLQEFRRACAADPAKTGIQVLTSMSGR